MQARAVNSTLYFDIISQTSCIHLQDEILKGAAEAAVQRREAAEATATPDERIAIQHVKAARAKDLRKKEVSG